MDGMTKLIDQVGLFSMYVVIHCINISVFLIS